MPRADMIVALEALANQTLHASWTVDQRTRPDFDDAVHWLIDDTWLDERPASKADGYLFRTDEEAVAVQRVVDVLCRIIDRLGDSPHSEYMRDADWPRVVETTRTALDQLRRAP